MIEALFFLAFLTGGFIRKFLLFPIMLLYDILFKHNDY